MKKILYISAVVLLCCVLFLPGCKKGDGEKDFGLAYIYMPQALATDGVNNHYAVPAGQGSLTHNYIIEDGKLKVILGVLLSGSAKSSGFSVDVVPMTTQTEDVINAGTIAGAMLLPAGAYTLPETVSVGKGSNSNAFYLAVDLETIEDQAYAGKKFLLQVGIANPTKYDLNHTNTSVMVIIDADKIAALTE